MTFFIAEIGSNWRSIDEAKRSIEAAAKAGAHAAKFQWFSEADLYGTGSDTRNFTEKQIEELAVEASRHKIEFMCTVFNHKLVPVINKYVRRHKIASSEMCYTDLVDASLETGKPVIVSVGGHTLEEVERVVVEQLLEKEFTLLYCCNAYPSTRHDLRWIDELRKEFSCDVGFSDHSTDVYTAYSAVEHFRAMVIEKHVKIDKDMDTPDSGHSITFDDLRSLVDACTHDKRLPFRNPEESEAVAKHNRRLIATRALNVGDALQYNRNFGMYRSREASEGLAAESIKDIEGTRATVPLRPGDVIKKDGYK